MKEMGSSNPPVVTGICGPNKSRARHHRSLKLGSKLKYLPWRSSDTSQGGKFGTYMGCQIGTFFGRWIKTPVESQMWPSPGWSNRMFRGRSEEGTSTGRPGDQNLPVGRAQHSNNYFFKLVWTIFSFSYEMFVFVNLSAIPQPLIVLKPFQQF